MDDRIGGEQKRTKAIFLPSRAKSGLRQIHPVYPTSSGGNLVRCTEVGNPIDFGKIIVFLKIGLDSGFAQRNSLWSSAKTGVAFEAVARHSSHG